jgi:hypothetical protein
MFQINWATMPYFRSQFSNILLIINTYAVFSHYDSTPIHWNAQHTEFRRGVPGDTVSLGASQTPQSPSADSILEAQSHPQQSWCYGHCGEMWKTIFASLSRKACMVLIALSLVITMISVILAIWWSVTRDDISGGWTLGGFVVSISAIALGIAGILHRRECKCWDSQQYI